jgi:hypothetical protein
MSPLFYLKPLQLMKLLFFMLSFLFLIQGCGSGEPETTRRPSSMNEIKPSVNMNALIVNVIPDTLPGGILNSDLVKVSLVNAGRSKVKVAARLSIGYEDSDSREIYAIIRNRSTGEIVGKRSQLYEREPFPLNQVRLLGPGEKVSTEFHLREWYEIPEGDLEIQIVYDPGEAAERFPEIQARIFTSDFVPFVMKRKH